MIKAAIKKVARWIKLLSAIAHLTIATAASMAAAGVFTTHKWFLAALIAWANICTAVHRYVTHQQEKDK